jgi:hypothetical protein
VKSVADSLGLTEFIRHLPNGYNTVLDPEGRKLPAKCGSENSARKKYCRSTSIASPREYDELKLRQVNVIESWTFYATPSQPWTMVAISSDPYFLGHADRVINLENGKINGVF